jgi:Clostridial hydrophobic W
VNNGMSEAGNAVRKPPEAEVNAPAGTQNRVTELKVSGHLMTLDTGIFCVFQAPGSPSPNDRSGLPGVRISMPPGASGRPDAVSISTFRDDGWLDGQDAAALVRVAKGPAQVLVTVYQAPTATPETAPRLQVMRLGPEQGAEGRASAPMTGAAARQAVAMETADVVAHVQRTGDVPGRIGEWIGTRGSGLWIEGFSLTPRDGVEPDDIEYQAVLGRGWLSPWIEGGKFCGSRGMALPLLGLKVRLKGAAARTYECSCSGSFVDGSAVGPVPGGETCEAESLAALEAFQVLIHRRGGAQASRGTAPSGARTRAERSAPAVDKPAPGKPPARTPKPAGPARRSRS